MSNTLLFNSLNTTAPDENAMMGGAGMEEVLKDVSNLPQKRRLSSPNDKYRLVSSYSSNEQINLLLKEKMILMKQIADRNKLVELSGIELQKLRINLLEVQQQNRHLARTNSQLLAEINADRDKLRVLRHELACAQAVVAVKDFELLEKKKGKMHPQTAVKMPNIKAGDPSQTNNTKNKLCGTRGKRLSMVGITSSAKGLEAKEKSENRRRQSSTFETEEVKYAEDVIKAVEGVPETEKSKCRRLSLSRQSSPSVTEGAHSCQDATKACKGVPINEKTKSRSLVSQSPTFQTEDINSAEEVVKTAEGVPTCEKPNNRRVSLRMQSILGTREVQSVEPVLKANQSDPTEEKSQAKRLNHNRRRSSRFITQDSTKDTSEVDAASMCPQLKDGNNEDDSVPLADSISKTALVETKNDYPAAEEYDEDAFDAEDTKSHLRPRVTEGSVDDSAARYIRRSSLARPIRKAAEKVQSYKEAPIRSKMRRID